MSSTSYIYAQEKRPESIIKTTEASIDPFTLCEE